jgi:hypothetical protein
MKTVRESSFLPVPESRRSPKLFSIFILLGVLVGGASAQEKPGALVKTDLSRVPASAASRLSERPRVVVLTDFPPLDVMIDSGPADKRSDPDDVQSMVRFLLYADDFDVEGLVASSATFANIANKTNLLDILDLYAGVVGNLKRHDVRYPTADQLRSITWQGSSGTYGRPAKEIIGFGKDSEASEQIIALLDRPDSRPIWFCVWGGSCDLAQALWKIKETRNPAETDRLLEKVRVYLITLQDGTGQWLLDTFPKLFVIAAKNSWMGMFGVSDLAWVNANIRQDHGKLGAIYPTVAMGAKPGVKEGDSPSFLYLVSAVRGLNDPEQPNRPSWGGQFVRVAPDQNHWTDLPSGGETVRRWSEAFENDFAARMNWCVKDFKEANHPPVARLQGGLQRDVKPGETVKLAAIATDPDGNQLACKWHPSAEANFAAATVNITRSDSPDQASFIVPNESGKEIHLILEVTDNGTPRLAGYQQIDYKIK